MSKFIKPITSLDEVTHFNIVKSPLFDARRKQIPLMAITREDDGTFLGTCSDKYRPIQIDEMIDTIDTACKQVDAPIKHVGFAEVNGGAKILIKSEVEGLSNGSDPMNGFLYTLIDNTGKNSNKIIPSMIRIACMNALHLIRQTRSDKQGNSLRHSDSFDVRVENFRSNLAHNIGVVKNFQEVMEKLRGRPYSEISMRALANMLIPVTKNESSRVESKRNAIIDRFTNGIGNSGSTRWDALNAVTETESREKMSLKKMIRMMTSETLSTRALHILNG